jgi:hypothetical protein
VPRYKNRYRGETGDVAGTITWEQLRELAAFRAEHGCAVSLYVGLDPSIVPTAGDLASHVRSLLARAERQLNEQRSTLSADERKAIARSIERSTAGSVASSAARAFAAWPCSRGARGSLPAAPAALAGRGRGPHREAALPRAARPPGRTRRRGARRLRRPRTWRRLPAARRPADPARGRVDGRARPP